MRERKGGGGGRKEICRKEDIGGLERRADWERRKKEWGGRKGEEERKSFNWREKRRET